MGVLAPKRHIYYPGHSYIMAKLSPIYKFTST
jgi:hypothetical protein